jgi:hypothetical protein
MMLADLLARLADESAVAESVLHVGGLRLLAALRQGAEREGLELGAFAIRAVQRYETNASDEEWITLMGEIARSTDPGLAFIKRALVHTLDAPSRRRKPSAGAAS